MAAEPLLLLDAIGVRFGGLKAVDAVSLRVPRGERHAVIGPNGAGKTTLFNAISGVVRPTSGRVLLGGRDITSASPHRRAGMGISRTFQITNLFPTLSVFHTMLIALRGLSPRKFSLFGAGAPTAQERDRMERALGLARIPVRTTAPVSELSYGEQRQLELAVALATEPRLLLLDEPAAGLSPSERGIVTDVIRSLPAELTLVLIEHDMDLILSLVDRVTCLENGRFLADGAPDTIRDNQAIQDVYLGRARAHA